MKLKALDSTSQRKRYDCELDPNGELSIRAYNSLRHAGISRKEDIPDYYSLLQMKRIGEKTAIEILSFIGKVKPMRNSNPKLLELNARISEHRKEIEKLKKEVAKIKKTFVCEDFLNEIESDR